MYVSVCIFFFKQLRKVRLCDVKAIVGVIVVMEITLMDIAKMDSHAQLNVVEMVLVDQMEICIVELQPSVHSNVREMLLAQVPVFIVNHHNVW